MKGFISGLMAIATLSFVGLAFAVGSFSEGSSSAASSDCDSGDPVICASLNVPTGRICKIFEAPGDRCGICKTFDEPVCGTFDRPVGRVADNHRSELPDGELFDDTLSAICERCGGDSEIEICKTFQVSPRDCKKFEESGRTGSKGYYVKITINGKSNEEWTGVCMSNGSIISMLNGNVSAAIAMGFLKLGLDNITVTQCADSTCSDTGPIHNNTFTLSQSGSAFKASPSVSEIRLQAFGRPCTVSPQAVITTASINIAVAR